MSCKLSIIVPVYNVVQYLRHCLQSLTEQGLQDYEVLLINDASRDNSRGICSEWCAAHPEFRLINHSENRGLSEARNTGILEAKGEWITFVDSDDFLAEKTYSKIFEILDQHSDEDIDIIEYPIKQKHLSAAPILLSFKHRTLDFQSWMSEGGHRHCYACNKLFRRSIWQDNRFPAGRYFEDIFTIPYIMRRAHKILQVDQGLYYYCDRTGSISNRQSEQCLYDYIEANNKLLLLPENQKNYDLYLRTRNGEISYNKISGKRIRLAKRMKVPFAFAFRKGLTLNDRIKALWLAIQTIV